ncbi:OmpA family protein [Agaribacterium sp. ZY112]|uniref:OmpA family protein n=1 Tax=Agaribacterium sp. ZY112 TaxID=3233574 RepID=UPI0035252717
MYQVQVKRLAAFIFASGIAAVSVQAEERAQGLTLTPMLGFSGYDMVDANVKEAAHYALGVGYQLSSPLSVELAYQKSPTETGYGTDLDVEQLRADLMYDFMHSSKLRPYLVAGLGQQSYKNDDFADEHNDFGNLGAGVKFDVHPKVALRGDVRANHDFNESHNSYTANLGVQFFFGKTSSPKPMAVAAVAPADADKDGVKDEFDQCANTPAGTKVDVNGCALAVDSDGDGVVDTADKCPDTKAGAKVDADGCYLMITEDKEATLHVKFAHDSDEIVEGHDSLQKVADFMRSYPTADITIAGHSDSRGDAAYNQKLSQKRADAVRTILINDFGVDGTRVTSVGYGEEQPIASNDTEEGRKQNRRVTASVKAQVETIKQ